MQDRHRHRQGWLGLALAVGVWLIAPSAVANGSIYDFGDAPAPYPTLLAADGARHALGGALYLGPAVDDEADGQPDATATGDDLAGSTPDDEDGVSFASIVAGTTGSVTIVASAAGIVNAWVDFDLSGGWSVDDRILTDVPVAAGANVLSFPVPVNLTPGNGFARVRIDSGGGLAPTGAAADGEVEDHAVTLNDADSDGDGIGNLSDNCPTKRNASQADKDGDGIGNKCDPDLDGDLIDNVIDNCPTKRNASQADKDGDGIGNKCDPDLDGDLIDNVIDNCPTKRNASQADKDSDGYGNKCDAFPGNPLLH